MLHPLRIAWRTIRKHTLFMGVNIVGLGLGMACFMLLGLYIFSELSYESHLPGADHLYRVVEESTEADKGTVYKAMMPAMLGTSIVDEMPTVQSSARVLISGRLTAQVGEFRDYIHFAFADSNFFSTTGTTLLHGLAQHALKNPKSIVLPEDLALKFFGSTDVVGKTIKLDLPQATAFEVTGVMQQKGLQTHFSGVPILPIAYVRQLSQALHENMLRDYSSNTFVTYIQLTEAAVASEVEAALNKIMHARQQTEPGRQRNYTLQPITDIHFDTRAVEGGLPHSPISFSYIYIFGAVGIFILLIACFNYINLSMAMATLRYRDVGVRKVIGASAWQLRKQYFTEAILLTALAIVLACQLVALTLPWFKNFIGAQVTLSSISWLYYAALIGFMLIVGIASGSYPSFFLVHLRPIQALQAKAKNQKNTFGPQRVLVTLQFGITILVLVVTAVVYSQLNYIRTKDKGFDAQGLVVVDINSGFARRKSYELKTAFSKVSGVAHVSTTSRVPGEWKEILYVDMRLSGTDKNARMMLVGADGDFLPTFDVQLLTGRNLGNTAADSNAVLVNETAARMLGINTLQAQQIEVLNGVDLGNKFELDKPYRPHIVGIVKDFHMQGLRDQIAPLIIAYRDNPVQNIDYFTLRVDMRQFANLLPQIKQAYDQIDPGNPLEYNILNDRLRAFYVSDELRGRLFLIASGLLVAIACMGLLAMTVFTTSRRLKEIAIRKVLGARSVDIALLMSREFLWIVGIAIFIALPIGVMLMNQWLADFAYHVELGYGLLLGVAAAVVSIGLGIVNSIVLRAANRNPIQYIKSE